MMGIRRLVPLGLLIGLVVSCGSDDATTRAVGDGCYVATDCTSPLVCAFQRCHGQCADSRDCPAGQECVGSDYPKLGICLLADETECTRHSDCPAPLVCGRRSKCEEQCKSDRDCLASQVCGQGSCYEAPAGGADAGPPPVAGKESDTCVHTSDCQAPLICLLGFCAPECVADRDCPTGLTCVDRVCRNGSPPGDGGADGTATDGTSDASIDGAPPDAPPGYGKTCSFTSECAGDLVCRGDGTCGYECITDADCPTKSYCTALHRCVVGTRPVDAAVDAPGDVVGDGKACSLDFDCDDGVFCNGAERCLAGRCGAPAELACDPHSSCFKGVCDEASRKCLAPIKIGSGTDVDGDGHLDVACGGDDCDDTNPSTFTGAPERCDGVDNDCDRIVDDFAIVPRSSVVTSPVVTGRDRTGGGGAVIAGTPTIGLSYSFMPGYNTGSAADTSHVMVTGTDLATGTSTIGEKEFSGASPGGVWGGGTFGAAAGGDSTSLVIFDYNNGSTLTRYAMLGAADGTKKLTLALVPGTTATLGDKTVTWTGSRYLVGFAVASSTSTTGSFGTIGTDGTYAVFPVAATGGVVASGSGIRVAQSGGSLAVAWQAASGDTELAIHTIAGAKLYGPITIAPGNPVAIGGTSAGFAVAVTTASATKVVFVSSAGVVGTAIDLAYPSVGGDGSTMLGAAILALEAKDGLHLVVGRGDLTDGVDDRSVYTPGTWAAADRGHVDVIGSRILLSYFADADNRTRFVEAGCLP